MFTRRRSFLSPSIQRNILIPQHLTAQRNAGYTHLNTWLKRVRNYRPVKEWWPILAAKLRGHYQYYGVSGNMPNLQRYYRLAMRLALKWLNRRSQRSSFNWAGFNTYLKHYPLPKPRIVHNLYTLSPVT
jgi:RNA-directed DNA polymerase